MALNTKSLSESLYSFYQEACISMQVNDLGKLKAQIKEKTKVLANYHAEIAKHGKGREHMSFLGRLSELHTEYKAYEEDFQDKLMIFIVGDGNVGKSTLLNSFVGYEAAKTSFAPLTWKIDVFDPGQKEKTLVKFKDGSKKTFTIDQAKAFLGEEENKTATSRKVFNEELRKVKDTVKTTAELEEYKKYLGKRHLYVSNVTEARWPVKNNWILEKCLLVDTPGMNQYLSDQDQIGNISDYYHKADGIIWLLDGNTIASANPKTALETLESNIRHVGGLRQNIIAVINKIDLVERNGGEESVRKVLADAARIYGNKFRHIVGISSKEAFEGIQQKNGELTRKSGIQALTDAVKDVFITGSQELKAQAKNRGNLKLMDQVMQETDQFAATMVTLQEKYQKVQKEYPVQKEKLSQELQTSMESFMESYLAATKSRIQSKVDQLANGYGESYILNEMYQIKELEKDWVNLMGKLHEMVVDEANLWKEYSRISEYTYIKVNQSLAIPQNALAVRAEGISLGGIKYFKPSIDSGLFSMLGNLWGKVAFAFRRSSIIEKITKEITDNCSRMVDKAMERYGIEIDAQLLKCQEILDLSFETALMPYEKSFLVQSATEEFRGRFLRNNLSHTSLHELLAKKTR